MRQFLGTKLLALVVLFSVFALIAAACAGPEGPAGERGPAGSTGPTGAVGPEGPKGDTGAQGTAGLKGDTGAQGSAGLKGDTGAQGPAGETVVSPASIVVGSATVSFPVYVAAVGDQVWIMGSGFQPGESVLLHMGGQTIPGGSATANAVGAFEVTTSAIPEATPPGLYAVTATGDQGTEVTAPLKIVAREK